MSVTDTHATRPAIAVTRRQEVCNIAFELETSAQVLEALCRYRHVSGMTEPDEWIAALAEFLLSMQRDDGLFDLAYEAETGERSSPGANAGSPIPQAKAAVALLLAHGELGLPRYGGVELLTMLRKTEPTRELPVVVLTGQPDKESMIRERGLEISEFLAKPVPLRKLVEVVETALLEARTPAGQAAG